MSGDCRETALEVAGKGPGGSEMMTITEGGRLVQVAGEKNDASDAAVRALLIDKKVHETPGYGLMDAAARKQLARGGTDRRRDHVQHGAGGRARHCAQR